MLRTLVSTKVRLVLGSALAAVALLAGCQSSVTGMPVTEPLSPTEPDFPTTRPPRTPEPSATPTSSAKPTPSTQPGPTRTPSPPGQVLQPQNGYVFVETKSGRTRCQLSRTDVGCESEFANAIVINGIPANGVSVTADGQLRWVLGNLGAIPAVTLDYSTYRAVGWTIDAGQDGTRFTNDSTGHGMFVSVQGVEAF